MIRYAASWLWWALGYKEISEEMEFDMLNPQLRSITQYYEALDEKKNHRYYFDRSKSQELYL